MNETNLLQEVYHNQNLGLSYGRASFRYHFGRPDFFRKMWRANSWFWKNFGIMKRANDKVSLTKCDQALTDASRKGFSMDGAAILFEEFYPFCQINTDERTIEKSTIENMIRELNRAHVGNKTLKPYVFDTKEVRIPAGEIEWPRLVTEEVRRLRRYLTEFLPADGAELLRLPSHAHGIRRLVRF